MIESKFMLECAGLITEVSLSRALAHFKNKNIPVGIITAFRDKSTYSQNVAKNVTLASTFKSSGYGYTFLDGGWSEKKTEDDDTTIIYGPDGKPEMVDVEETSVFVIGNKGDDGNLLELMLKQANRFKQDSILFKPEGELDVYIIDADGSKFKIGNSFTKKKLEDGWSQLRGGRSGKSHSRGRKGRVFAFESAHIKKSMFSTMKFLKENKI